jgi:hypothetical protein
VLYPAGRRRAPLGRAQVAETLADASSLDGYARSAALGAYMELTPAARRELEPLARQVFTRHVQGRYRRGRSQGLPTKVPTSWWAAAGPLGAHALTLLCEERHELELDELAKVLSVAELDGSASPRLARSLARPSDVHQLLLADRVCTPQDVTVVLDRQHLDADDLAMALCHLHAGPVRDEALSQLRSGAMGRAYCTPLEVLRSLGLSLPELVAGAAADELSTLAADLDDDGLRELVGLLDAGEVSWLLESVPAHSQLQDRIVELALEHTGGLLEYLADPLYGGMLAVAVLEALEAALGDDQAAWSQLWALGSRWPGTVPAAVACVRACRA